MEIYKPIVLQVVSLLFLLAFFFFAKLKKSYWLSAAFLLFLLLFVISVFVNRDYSANIDLPLYMDFYKYNQVFADIFESKTAWKGDFLFFGLMPVSHLLGFDQENYITLQLILSISLTFIAYFKFFKENRAFAFLALFFMLNSSSFYLIHGNVIRQGLASSLLLIGLCTTVWEYSLLSKIAAFLSHKGSVFSFLTKFLNIGNKTRIWLLIGALVIGYFSLFIYVLNILPLPAFVETKIGFYSTFERASSNSLIKLILLLGFNLLFLFLRSKELKYEKVYDLFFVFSIAALLLFRFDGMFSRLVLYTDIFIPFLSVGLIQQFSIKKNKSIAVLITISCSFIYSVYVFNHDSILFNMGKYFKI
ncbi:MAG: EpsG family protein [Maribacter sp.]